jgi:GNAT superfamily N-acetyltransferase
MPDAAAATDLELDLAPFSGEIRDAYLDLLPEQEAEVAGGKLDWKFRNNPAGPGLIATAREDGRLLGVNAFMAAAFRVDGERLRGYQSMDTVVTPAARGKGVFGRLVNCFYDEAGADLLYGFPNLNSSPGFFGKLGWLPFGPVPMLMRPLRTGVVLKRISRFLPDLPVPIFSRPLREARAVDRFGDEATSVWNRFAAPIGCAVERDAAFLNWRLADHPTERYQLWQAPDGAFAASNVTDKHGGRIGYLMEAVGPKATLAPLISTALRDMKARGAEIAFAWCLPGSPNYRAHRKAGFYPFSPRLRPIIINFGARPLGSDSPSIRDARSWYLSYLDSDTV